MVGYQICLTASALFFPLPLGSIRHLFLSNFGENYVNLVFIDFLGKKSRCPTASYRLQTKHCLGAQLLKSSARRGWKSLTSVIEWLMSSKSSLVKVPQRMTRAFPWQGNQWNIMELSDRSPPRYYKFTLIMREHADARSRFSVTFRMFCLTFVNMPGFAVCSLASISSDFWSVWLHQTGANSVGIQQWSKTNGPVGS